MFSLYFHIPFCTKKCSYCHFYVIPDKDPFKLQLMEGFEIEWNLWLPKLKGKTLTSIYFGGGTPALLGANSISRILGWVKQSFPLHESLEITLEANPENITFDLMKSYADAGITRVSIGVQSLDDKLLATLGRTHDSKKALDSIIATKNAGIENISIDLMYDLPHQTLEIWQETLQGIKNSPITHLSLYNLTIEPHTPFFKRKAELQKHLPDEENSLHMYESAILALDEMGLLQYEISAFAKSNKQSNHNVGYWTARPFLGLGPSAYSYWNHHRFRNIANLNKYLYALKNNQSSIDFDENLDDESRIKELLAVRIRLTEGINLEKFQLAHGELSQQTIISLQKLKYEGYIAFSNNQKHVSLTKKGILFYDSVAIELI